MAPRPPRGRPRLAGGVCLTWLASGLTGACTGGLGGGARAADLKTGELPTDTVAKLERMHEYDQTARFGAARVSDRSYSNPEGVRLGNFVFFPTLGTLVRLDDNIYTSATDRKKDLVTEITP